MLSSVVKSVVSFISKLQLFHCCRRYPCSDHVQCIDVLETISYWMTEFEMLLSSTSIFSQVLNEMECSICILYDTTIALHRKKFLSLFMKLTSLFLIYNTVETKFCSLKHATISELMCFCLFSFAFWWANHLVSTVELVYNGHSRNQLKWSLRKVA